MPRLRILFATFSPLLQGPAGLSADLASTRYRVLIPADQLRRLGHEVQIVTLPKAGWSDIRIKPCDVLVISKSFHSPSEILANAMKERGVKVVADFCDDYFDDPQYGPHFRNLAALADTLTASTEAMAQALRRHTGRDALVITDPVEGPRGVPRFEPRFPELRLAWFGHPTNVDGLVARAGQLKAAAAGMPLRLSVVTSPIPEVTALLERVKEAAGPRVRVELVPWSVEATWSALAACDAAWIPVVDSDVKAVKSPNRLLEAAWAGRWVIADAVPAYLPHGDLLSVGEGLAQGLARALENPQEVVGNLAAMQRRVAREHSAFACGNAWAAALGDTDERPVRLNLGCGDKILPGYVNVDVVESRLGARPDVVCDLHDLAPFDDASADEILSVHVVEHFWRWEIADVLREWVRVLKPGAPMIVECPNILAACDTFLKDPARGAREDEAGRSTMWVLYGDPQWKDPLMIHRWGYTPESLKALLAEAGLVDVRQEPAQFKLREPRDMRIVGTRP